MRVFRRGAATLAAVSALLVLVLVLAPEAGAQEGAPRPAVTVAPASCFIASICGSGRRRAGRGTQAGAPSTSRKDIRPCAAP